LKKGFTVEEEGHDENPDDVDVNTPSNSSYIILSFFLT
jgi:hypothetical protein